MLGLYPLSKSFLLLKKILFVIKIKKKNMFDEKLYKYRKVILLFILLLAFGLRFYGALSIPAHEDNLIHDFPSARKISLEPGNFNIPLVETMAESSGMGWKYLIRIGWYLFGDSLIGARLPFIILGVATIFLVYLLVNYGLGNSVALFSSFLLAISSYHIGLTRNVDDVSVGCFFALGSLFLLYQAVQKSKPKLLLVNGLLIGLSLWLKEINIFLIPITIIFLYSLPQYKGWLKNGYLWLSFFLAFMVALPLIVLNLNPEVTRFNYIMNQADFGLSINAIGFYLGELILLALKPFPDLFSKIAVTVDEARPFVNFLLGGVILASVVFSFRDRRPFIRLLLVTFLFNFAVFSIISHIDKSSWYWTMESSDWSAMSFIPGVILAANMLIVFLRKYKIKAALLSGVLLFFVFIRSGAIVTYPLNYYFPTRDFYIKRFLLEDDSWMVKSDFINEANVNKIKKTKKDVLKRIYDFYDQNYFYKRISSFKLAQMMIEEKRFNEAKKYIYTMLYLNPCDKKARRLLETINNQGGF
jgi:hypothetical protein